MSIKDRGFASITMTRMREIARMGAAAALAKGTGHRFTAQTAMAAGRKGGAASAAKRRAAKAGQS